MTVYVYLNFFKDKSVPDCILPDNTLIELCYFSAERQAQQPFLQWCVSLTKNLQRFETSLSSGLGTTTDQTKDPDESSRSPRTDLVTHAV